MRGRLLGMTVLLLTTPLLAGCTDTTTGLPRLSTTVADDTVQWGSAAQVTIKNSGQGPASAPLTVQIIAASDGSVVRTIEDITGGRGLPAGGQITVTWNGSNDAGKPVLWGNYTMAIDGYDARSTFELLKPPNYAITIDPIPRETPAGDPMEFRLNNTGNVWLNGTITIAAGRGDDILYTSQAEVQLPPKNGYSFFWNGRYDNGTEPEPDKYLVATKMELEEEGPRPFAQDVFTLT